MKYAILIEFDFPQNKHNPTTSDAIITEHQFNVPYSTTNH